MKSISLRKKLITFVVIPVIICTSLVVVLSSIKIYKQGINNLIDKSNTILNLNILEFTYNHFNGNTVVNMDAEEALNDITTNIDKTTGQYTFRISSPNPTDNKYQSTESDLQFIKKLANENINEITHINKKTNELLVIRPVYMSESKGCLECHENSNNTLYGNLRGIFMVSSNMQQIQNEVKLSILENSIVGLIIMLIAIGAAIYLASTFTKPIVHLKQITEKLAQGDLEQTVHVSTNDEIGIIGKAFNKLINSLKKTAEFSYEIGKGNYNTEFNILSEKDTIGKSLLSMRESLIDAQEREKERKTKEKQENWTNQGIAKFSEILRTDSNNIETLAENFIINLVNYINAAQGGLFILNENNGDAEYELKGAVAFNRKKALQKSFKPGDSLVGRCAFEKLTIFITDVPENYANITSGLGDANPRCILLVPAIMDDKVYGVIELISFNVFEPYMIEFAKMLGENLASTISNTLTNEQTKKLLSQTQEQSERLNAQEEEMRQNLEELQATQEEMKRKEMDLTQENISLKNKIDELTNNS